MLILRLFSCADAVTWSLRYCMSRSDTDRKSPFKSSVLQNGRCKNAKDKGGGKVIWPIK